MKIVIAEKPSLGKAIASFFGATQTSPGCIKGQGVAVTWCFGHMYEQANPEVYDAKYASWSPDLLPIVPGKWKLLPKSDVKQQLDVIAGLLRSATEVIHAGDPDREGQLLIDEVLEAFGYTGPVKRLWLAALDDASIKKAVSSMKDGAEYRNLKLAAECRARADWLVGMNLTRLWTKYGEGENPDSKVLSVGRVQTPTLAMIVKRDMEIAKFVSRDFFEVEGSFPFPATWQPGDNVSLSDDGKLLNIAVAQGVATKVKGKSGLITKYDSKKCSQAAPLPHSLSSLQQAASAKLGLSAKETLDIAQELYEVHMMTTYPRTDCRYLPVSMHTEASEVMGAMVGEYRDLAKNADASRKSAAFNDKQITAHHAIIPTKKTDVQLSGRVKAVYDLIVRAYLSQFYPEHMYQQVSIALACENETFTATGRTVIQPGWKSIYSDGSEEDEKASATLPVVQVGQSVTCSDAVVKSKKTSPPKHYTDGTLIAAMTSVYKIVEDPEIKKRLKDTAGIGTEATRAGIIETLITRRFIEKKGKQLISTSTGKNLIAALDGAEITNVGMTGVFEGRLDGISTGEVKPDEFLSEIIKDLTDQINDLRPRIKKSTRQYSSSSPKKEFAIPANAPKCPVCKTGSMVRKKRKDGGFFWGCSDWQKTQCKGSADDKDGVMVPKK